jgi:hypothetical protein
MHTIESAVLARRIPLGGASFTPEVTSSMVARGYRVLYNGFDVLMLTERVQAFKSWT